MDEIPRSFSSPFRCPSPSPPSSESNSPRDGFASDSDSECPPLLMNVNEEGVVYPEILIAAAWWTEALRNGAIGLNYLPLIRPSSSIDKYSIFYQSLSSLLYSRYQSHWYPSDPCRGSGFRSISYDNRFDRLLKLAGEKIHLNEKESMILFAHCRFIIMKINPGSVKIVKGIDTTKNGNVSEAVITGNTFTPPVLLYYSNNHQINQLNQNNSNSNNNNNNQQQNPNTNTSSSSSLPPRPPSTASVSVSASPSVLSSLSVLPSPRSRTYLSFQSEFLPAHLNCANDEIDNDAAPPTHYNKTLANHHVKAQQELKEKEGNGSLSARGSRTSHHKQAASMSNDLLSSHHHRHHSSANLNLPPSPPRHQHNHSMNMNLSALPPTHHHHTNSSHHIQLPPKPHHYKTNSINNIPNHSLPPLPSSSNNNTSNPVITIAPIADYKRQRALRNTKKFMSQPFIDPSINHNISIVEHHHKTNSININTNHSSSYYYDSSDSTGSDSDSPTSASSSSSSKASSPTLSPISLFPSDNSPTIEFSLIDTNDYSENSPPASFHKKNTKSFGGYFGSIAEEKSDHINPIKELFPNTTTNNNSTPSTTASHRPTKSSNSLWGPSIFDSNYSNSFNLSIFAQPIDRMD